MSVVYPLDTVKSRYEEATASLIHRAATGDRRQLAFGVPVLQLVQIPRGCAPEMNTTYSRHLPLTRPGLLESHVVYSGPQAADIWKF